MNEEVLRRVNSDYDKSDRLWLEALAEARRLGDTLAQQVKAP